MSNKEEAVKFIRKCLRKKIKPEDVYLPELTVPEDIADSIEMREDKEAADRYGVPLKRVYLGKFFLGIYFEEDEKNGKPPAPQALHDNIRTLMEEYYMLKPVEITLEKNAAGKYVYLCCTILYDRDCCEKTIMSDSIEDINGKLWKELALVVQRYGNPKEQAMFAVGKWLENEDMNRFLMIGVNMRLDESITGLVDPYFTDEVRRSIHGRNFCQSTKGRWTSIWRLGNFKWTTEREPNQSEQEDISGLFEKGYSTFRKTLYSVLFEFCYLKPGPVTYEQNQEGEYVYICCTIQYGPDGYPQKIKAETFADFVWSMQYAAYMLTHAEPMTRKEEARLYVRCCLIGYIPYGCVTEPEIIMHERFSEWTNIPEEFVESHQIILRNAIRENMKRYYMLKPGSVTFEKCVEDDDYLDFCCTIEYSRDGTPKKIKGQTLEELTLRMEIERDMLMKGEKVLMEYKEYNAGTDLKYYFESDNGFNFPIQCAPIIERKKDRLWRLLSLLISGTEEEQSYARFEIKELCGNQEHSFGDAVKLASKKNNLLRTEQTDQESGIKRDYFYAVINRAIGKNRLYPSAGSLANTIALDPGQLSRVRHGKSEPTKGVALRLGIALQLSRIEMTKFMDSAGHSFPVDKRDVLVLEAMEKGNRDYQAVVTEVLKQDETINLI